VCYSVVYTDFTGGIDRCDAWAQSVGSRLGPISGFRPRVQNGEQEDLEGRQRYSGASCLTAQFDLCPLHVVPSLPFGICSPTTL